jgi:hypothetical protein
MANYGELSLLEQARSGGGSGERGAATLGAILGGGARRSQEAFNNGAYSGAKLADVLAQARQRQQAEVGRQASYHAALAKGDNELANMFLYANPNEVADYEGKHQKTGYQSELWKRQNEGNLDDATRNSLLAIMKGEPSTSYDIREGMGFNPHGNPDQTPSVTPVGTATIAEKNALAGEHNAQAARATAGIGVDKAANWSLEPTADGIVRVNKLTGETSPLSMGGKPIHKEAAPKSLPEGIIKDYLQGANVSALPASDDVTGNAGEPNGKFDPTKVAAYISAKQRGLNDADALAAVTQSNMAANTQAANTPSPDMQNSLSAMAGATPKVGDSPHPEGTQLRGPDGKLYVVKNGQPVPL